MTLGHATASVPAITLSDPIRDLLVEVCGLENDTKGQLLAGGGVRARFPLRRDHRNQGRPQRDRLLPWSRSAEERKRSWSSAHTTITWASMRRARSITARMITRRARAHCWKSPRRLARVLGPRGAWRFSGWPAKRKGFWAANGSPIT